MLRHHLEFCATACVPHLIATLSSCRKFRMRSFDVLLVWDTSANPERLNHFKLVSNQIETFNNIIKLVPVDIRTFFHALHRNFAKTRVRNTSGYISFAIRMANLKKHHLSELVMTPSIDWLKSWLDKTYNDLFQVCSISASPQSLPLNRFLSYVMIIIVSSIH